MPKWIPREDLTEADELGRRPDASDWGCSKELVKLVLEHFGVTVELDLFASDIHHVTERFISAFYVPGCVAVQAFAQDCKMLLSCLSATVWAFPPTKLLSETLSFIERQRIDAIVITPTLTSTNEWIQVHKIEGQVSGPLHLPRRVELCQPSL
jgi:hypothetical protein